MIPRRMDGSRLVGTAGHYERSENDGKTWTRCRWRDAQIALGQTTASELRKADACARPYPCSAWGVLYRWVVDVVMPARKAG